MFTNTLITIAVVFILCLLIILLMFINYFIK